MGKMKFDYSKLKGRITEKCGTRKAFAKLLGIAEGTLVSKLSGLTYFSQKEIYKAVEILEIDQSEIGVYFFTQRVQKCEQ